MTVRAVDEPQVDFFGGWGEERLAGGERKPERPRNAL